MTSKWDGTPENSDVSGWHWVSDVPDEKRAVPSEWVVKEEAGKIVSGWGIECGIGDMDTTPEGVLEYYPYYWGKCLKPTEMRAGESRLADTAAKRMLNEAKPRVLALRRDGKLQEARMVERTINAVVKSVSERIWALKVGSRYAPKKKK